MSAFFVSSNTTKFDFELVLKLNELILVYPIKLRYQIKKVKLRQHRSVNDAHKLIN